MRINRTMTVTAGTPQNVAVLLGLDPAFPQPARRWTAQALIGGTGAIYVMDGVRPRGTTPAASTSGQLTAQLAPASATSPGSQYEDAYTADADNQGDIDLSLSWLDGSHDGDTVAVSANINI